MRTLWRCGIHQVPDFGCLPLPCFCARPPSFRQSTYRSCFHQLRTGYFPWRICLWICFCHRLGRPPYSARWTSLLPLKCTGILDRIRLRWQVWLQGPTSWSRLSPIVSIELRFALARQSEYYLSQFHLLSWSCFCEYAQQPEQCHHCLLGHCRVELGTGQLRLTLVRLWMCPARSD